MYHYKTIAILIPLDDRYWQDTSPSHTIDLLTIVRETISDKGFHYQNTVDRQEIWKTGNTYIIYHSNRIPAALINQNNEDVGININWKELLNLSSEDVAATIKNEIAEQSIFMLYDE